MPVLFFRDIESLPVINHMYNRGALVLNAIIKCIFRQIGRNLNIPVYFKKPFDLFCCHSILQYLYTHLKIFSSFNTQYEGIIFGMPCQIKSPAPIDNNNSKFQIGSRLPVLFPLSPGAACEARSYRFRWLNSYPSAESCLPACRTWRGFC